MTARKHTPAPGDVRPAKAASSIPSHEPRSHRGLLYAEPPAQGGILAPGGPSSGTIDRHPDAERPATAKPRPAARTVKAKRPKKRARKPATQPPLPTAE